MGEAGVALEAAGLLDPLQFVRERVYEVGCNWKGACRLNRNSCGGLPWAATYTRNILCTSS